jgi:hypothetical protein
MGVVAFSEEALTRIGIATLDAWEAVSDFTDTEFWNDLRRAIDAQAPHEREK